MPVEIAVAGALPCGPLPARRVTAFRTFQSVAGELEVAPAAQFPALHAVCHALMNGIAAVHVVGVENSEAQSVAASLAELATRPDVVMLLCPGDHGPDALRAIAGTVPDGLPLWLDAPRYGSVQDVAELHTELVAIRPNTRLIGPFVSTISPGRRATEPLPGSALAAPLLLGVCEELRGVHEAPGRLSTADATLLRNAGCGRLAAGGPRRTIRLAFPAPERIQTQSPPNLEQRMRDALELVFATHGYATRRPSLYRSVERDAKAAMERFVRAGQLTRVHVRCDEETCRDAHDGLGVEVVYQTPRRVEHLVLRVSSV